MCLFARLLSGFFGFVGSEDVSGAERCGGDRGALLRGSGVGPADRHGTSELHVTTAHTHTQWK